MTNIKLIIANILGNSEFIEGLKRVGGQTRYHQEGNALIHTIMVMIQAAIMWGADNLMVLVALMHDVGKITAHVRKPNGDFSYPNHAKVGAEMLGSFIDEALPEFPLIKWYVANHIRPLHWGGCGYDRNEAMEQVANHSDITVSDEMFDNLVKLAICDVLGSIPEDKGDQRRSVEYLESLLKRPIPEIHPS